MTKLVVQHLLPLFYRLSPPSRVVFFRYDVIRVKYNGGSKGKLEVKCKDEGDKRTFKRGNEKLKEDGEICRRHF